MIKYGIAGFCTGALVGILLYSKLTKPAVQFQETIKDRVVTVTKEVVRPDGTRLIDTHRTEDRAQIIVKATKHPWQIMLIGNSSSVGVGVSKEILGPVRVGALVERTNANLERAAQFSVKGVLSYEF